MGLRCVPRADLFDWFSFGDQSRRFRSPSLLTKPHGLGSVCHEWNPMAPRDREAQSPFFSKFAHFSYTALRETR